MNENNFNIMFEKIGHIEATQLGTYRLLERIEQRSKSFEGRLQKVERQTTRLLTISSVCASFVTIWISVFFNII